MGSSLINKFAATKKVSADGRKIFWNRADRDNLPFRGNYAPIMGEEEFEQRVVRVADTKNGYFDTKDEAQNQQYLLVWDGILNGWYKGLFIQRFMDGTSVHYVEWTEYYLEDGSPTPYTTNGIAELTHGQPNVPYSHQPHSG